MILKSLRAAAFALVLAAAPLAQAADLVPPIAYKERVLANGMKVLSSLDRTTPNVTVQVWYGVGSKDDPEGRSGFAHLFEHLMFKATRDMPAETVDRLTEDVGGFNNAFTADDMTAYYEVVPAHHLERILWAEAQRLGSLVVDEAVFKSERDVVKEELRQRVLSDPYGRLFSLVIPEESYSKHPYRRPTIGSIADLDAATIDDVLNFHATYYRPDNASLIVVGNFEQADLDAWVDRYFGALKTPAAPLPRVTALEPARTRARTVKAYAANVPLPAVAMTWQGPAASHPDAAALTVLDTILSGGKSSRLYDSLVYEQQIAQAAFSSAEMNAQPGLFIVGAILAGEHSLDEGEAALRAQVARARDEPPTDAELSEARNELIAGAVRQRETIDGRATALGASLLLEGDAAKANTGVAELAAVTAADVQRVARQYLDDGRVTVIRYADETERRGRRPVAKAEKPRRSGRFRGEVVTLAPEGRRQAPPPLGTAVDPVLPVPSETTLSNGLRVIVARSSDLPLVTAALTVRSGAAADPQGLAGTASTMADLLTEGTATRSATDIARQTEALGANLSAGSGWEASQVTLNVMPGNLAPAMAIMADVARNPAFAQGELDRVRTQALDGLSVAFTRPGSVAGFATAPVIHAGSPFGHVAGGTPSSLKRIARDDLAALHAAYWRPDNAVLILTGDLTPEEGFALARSAYGDWERPSAPLPPAPRAVAPSAPREIVIDMPDAGQAAVVVAKPAIIRTDPRYYQALVANTVLGGGFSARLSQEIRIKRGLSYGAGSALSAHRTTGSFAAQTQTKNPSAPEVVGLIRAEMQRLAEAPASPEELAARKSVLIGGYGRDLATTDGLAGVLADLALYDIELSEIAAFTGRVEAVQAAEVQAFAAQVLNPADASVIVVGDRRQFGKAFGAAEVITMDQLDLDSATLRKAP